MSVVTTILIDCSINEHGMHQRLNAIFGSVARNDSVEAAFAGTKFPQVKLYDGAYNYLNLEGALAQLAALPWERPNEVQLFINQEEDCGFGVWRLRNGRFVEVLPPPDRY